MMRVINVTVSESCAKSIPIGRRAETEATQVVFDVSSLEETFGSGTVIFYVKNSPTTDPYPATVEYADSTVTWTVSNVDTQYVGVGRCELWYYVGDTLAKTLVWKTVTEEDIGAPSATPPDPYETWLDTLTDLAAETQQNAQDAYASAQDAETAQGLAEGARDDAIEAKDDAQTAQANAETAEGNASTSATLAESWAVGGTGTRTGEDVNNSMYWAGLAEQSADQAGYVHFEIDDNGHLIYAKTPYVELNFTLSNGHLFVEVA